MTMTRTQDAHEDPVATQRLIVDQREANERMVAVAIQAHEMAEQAEAARALAEAAANELRESEERYRTEVAVEVVNRGAPIPADVLPFIFQAFRRARPKPSATGHLGLGLYIAHQIALAHGGTLDAHSADGITTFVMRLPRRSSTI